jgi:DNA-binding transcriptional MerR regulator
MVAYWAATKLIAPSVFDSTGTGNHRRFSIPDVLVFAALGAMRAHGVSLQALREVKRFLNAHDGSEFKDVHRSLVYAPGSRRFPHDVALLNDSEIVSLLRVPGQKISPVVVDVGELFKEVRDRLDKIPSERKARDIEKKKQRALKVKRTGAGALEERAPLQKLKRGA